MVRYIKCPRCELNYIDAEKDEYCEVCQKEMKGIPTGLEEVEDLEDELSPTELCPICGENMMRPGESMCEECRKKSEYEDEPDINDDEDDDEWREYLDDADGLAGIDESFDEEFGEEEEEPEEEEYTSEEEDLEYVTGDEIYTLGGDDDDEDEEEREDDDF